MAKALTPRQAILWLGFSLVGGFVVFRVVLKPSGRSVRVSHFAIVCRHAEALARVGSGFQEPEGECSVVTAGQSVELLGVEGSLARIRVDGSSYFVSREKLGI